MDVYEYWQHRTSGEVYAVRLRDGQPTGVCGPLDHEDYRTETELLVDRLREYEYDPEDADWIGTEADNFRTLDAPPGQYR